MALYIVTFPEPPLRIRPRPYAMFGLSDSFYVVAAAQTLVHQEGISSMTTLTGFISPSQTSSMTIRAFGSSPSSSLRRMALLRYFDQQKVPMEAPF